MPAYIVVRSIYMDHFQEQVNKLMAKGYSPIGGVAIGHDSTHAVVYCQALIRCPT